MWIDSRCRRWLCRQLSSLSLSDDEEEEEDGEEEEAEESLKTATFSSCSRFLSYLGPSWHKVQSSGGERPFQKTSFHSVAFLILVDFFYFSFVYFLFNHNQSALCRNSQQREKRWKRQWNKKENCCWCFYSNSDEYFQRSVTINHGLINTILLTRLCVQRCSSSWLHIVRLFRLGTFRFSYFDCHRPSQQSVVVMSPTFFSIVLPLSETRWVCLLLTFAFNTAKTATNRSDITLKRFGWSPSYRYWNFFGPIRIGASNGKMIPGADYRGVMLFNRNIFQNHTYTHTNKYTS